MRGILGTAVLVLYGVIRLPICPFRGWLMDGNKPDSFDLIGGTVSLLGVAIIMYWPR